MAYFSYDAFIGTDTRENSQETAVPMHSTPVRRASEMHNGTVPAARKRGRPRKVRGTDGHAAPAAEDGARHVPHCAPTPNDTARPKRGRGRPRIHPLTPAQEALRAAQKQGASIPPWQHIPPTDLPPRYPETHVYINTAPPQRLQWALPVHEKRAPPAWQHYKRPVRTDMLGSRDDKIAPEPIPPAPPGRRGRTRVDYLGLQHWQLIARARAGQLDVKSLWNARVRAWSKEYAPSLYPPRLPEEGANTNS